MPISSLRVLVLLTLTAVLLPACTPQIDVNIGAGGGSRSLEPTVLSADPNPGASRIALIDIRGVIYDASKPSLLGDGENPVDRFVAQLDLAAEDDAVKAIILRITSPGGTVTGSDIMYHELRRFADQTHKPIIASMGEVAASGGYYLAVGADHIIAEPTTITGSIGVIMPTLNMSEGLSKIGIKARSVKSGANKDIANPLEPMRDSQYAVLQGLVDEFYDQFKSLVLERRHIDPSRVAEATDGRVFSGRQALPLGLVDELGGIREAFTAAKRFANLESATLIRYASKGSVARSPYALAPVGASTPSSGLTLKLDTATSPLSNIAPGETSGIYYLWMPGTN